MDAVREKAVLIVVAAGAARRFGGDKLLMPLGGRPVFIHALERLAPAAARAVLVVPPGREAEFRRTVEKYLPPSDLRIVPGGANRPASVKCGLDAALPLPGELVAVHDAARPLASAELLGRLCRKAREVGGAVPGFPQADAQKRTDENGIVVADLPRANVWNVGTPQVFRAEELLRAYSPGCAPERLDDAEAVRAAGGRVAVVPATEPNIKITTPADLETLERLLGRRTADPTA